MNTAASGTLDAEVTLHPTGTGACWAGSGQPVVETAGDRDVR